MPRWIGAYEDINDELKRDIPLLLSRTETFFQPLILLLILNQSTFWSQMAQFTTSLAQRVDTSNAQIPDVQYVITPKQASAVTKKYSSITSNPWEKETLPALTYGGSTPALTAPPQAYNNVPPMIQQPPTTGGLPHRVPPAFPQNPTVHHPPAVNQGFQQQQNQAYVPQPGNPFANSGHSVPAPSPANPFGGRQLPQAKPQAKALWDFIAQNPDELSFGAGDMITIHEQVGDWWKGELHGRKGLLPANYVTLC